VAVLYLHAAVSLPRNNCILRYERKGVCAVGYNVPYRTSENPASTTLVNKARKRKEPGSWHFPRPVNGGRRSVSQTLLVGTRPDQQS